MRTTWLFSLVLMVVILLTFEAKLRPSRSAGSARLEKMGAQAAARGAFPSAPDASGGPAFDPDRLAYLEKSGWEAYYDRNWLRVFELMVQTNREEFHMSLPDAIAAAIDIIQASIAFKPIDNDVPAATAQLQRFYDKARHSLGLQTDAHTLAALEMDYWVVHRRLAQEREQAPDHTGSIEPMVTSLLKLHAALFTGASPEAIRRSAEMRAQAAATVDRITGGYSTDVPGDWRQIEADLREAYHSLYPAGGAGT
jgi:hypothetical protein